MCYAVTDDDINYLQVHEGARFYFQQGPILKNGETIVAISCGYKYAVMVCYRVEIFLTF